MTKVMVRMVANANCGVEEKKGGKTVIVEKSFVSGHFLEVDSELRKGLKQSSMSRDDYKEFYGSEKGGNLFDKQLKAYRAKGQVKK